MDAPAPKRNPDVLECLANLSNDEVFTPPRVANAMLDLLPQSLFADPKTTFLDPCCKSGVFLREIAKRLIVGLEPAFPDLETRLRHIFTRQLFGFAITELTALTSRRTVYGSKCANGKYAITPLDTPEGNILLPPAEHVWENGKCHLCGASQDFLKNRSESHTYAFIHGINPEEVFHMKFDVIIGNPPYQLTINEAGKGLGAIPIYQKFVNVAKSLSPHYIVMIIPARWFAGGVGLTDFRQEMLSDKRVHSIVDYIDSKECFPEADVNGGVCYFLWDKTYHGVCNYTNIFHSQFTSSIRNLAEYPIFIRRNEALSIVQKVQAQKERTLADEGGCSPQTPYGFLSTFIGSSHKSRDDDCEILSSKGWMFVPRREVAKSRDTIDLYKPMISKLSCEHAGNPDKSGMYRVLSRMEILKPGQICTQSYLTVCPSKTLDTAQNCYDYLRTKFVRFLILQTLVGMNISISNFMFVPWQDFSKPWTDEELYAKYGLTDEEVAFIESMVKPMEA